MSVIPATNTSSPASGGFQATDSRGVTRNLSPRGDPNQVIAARVGPAFWEYRRRWDLARTFQVRPAFPIHVDYELFYGCNLKCPICIMSLPPKERRLWGDPRQCLTLDTLKGLLEEGAACGQSAVGLNGICEPLLYEDLPEVIGYARDKGLLDIMFSTNGLLLEPPLSRELIDAGLTRLMISLDAATPETYHRIRVGSDFERVTENLRQFMSLRQKMGSGLPQVRVSFCVTSLNEHELTDFMETWSNVVDFISIQHYGNTFEGPRQRERSSLFPRGHKYDPGPRPGCGQPWKRVMVRHNGDVIPCCDASGLNLVIGNIHQSSLEAVWLGEAAEKIRRLHQQGRYKEQPICRQCMTKWGSVEKIEPDSQVG